MEQPEEGRTDLSPFGEKLNSHEILAQKSGEMYGVGKEKVSPDLDEPIQTSRTDVELAKKAGVGKSNMAYLIAVKKARPDIFEKVFNVTITQIEKGDGLTMTNVIRNEKVTELINKIKGLPEFNAQCDFAGQIFDIGNEYTEEEISTFEEDYGEKYVPNMFYVYEGYAGDPIGGVYKFSEIRNQFYSEKFPAMSEKHILKEVQKAMREFLKE